ncbi:MAG: lysophospholipase [Legionellales bacterium RIFCSPHIGHO2_12_FULL_42_9]|nr:MAG: lysophospholipase [Legionellales bacterium RIFCSPHIGHO2_12_FULL_42_9]
MKRIIGLILFLFNGLTFSVSLKNVVVFGDSLSDNGNLYEYMQHQLPLSPPYFEGRFSNGPLWVEHVLNFYFPETPEKHLLDYAFGGAGVSLDPNTEMLFTLDHEIDSYLLSHQEKVDAQSLFVVWVGANNYLDLENQSEQTVIEVNEGIKHSLQRLADAGALHILIFNLPDLGKTPYAKLVNARELLTRATTSHNQQLALTINQLQHDNPGVQWLSFDVNALLNSFLIEPQRFGFTNVDSTCYESMAAMPILTQYSKYSMVKVASRININSRQDHCEGYLFFDPIHPASRAHELMANHVQQLLDKSGIILRD